MECRHVWYRILRGAGFYKMQSVVSLRMETWWEKILCIVNAPRVRSLVIGLGPQKYPMTVTYGWKAQTGCLDDYRTEFVRNSRHFERMILRAMSCSDPYYSLPEIISTESLSRSDEK
jgi:hypothetical protein